MAPESGMPERPRTREILTVSELNRAVAGLLERSVPPLRVVGELSNFTRAASGHWYFTLKDASAQVRAVMFRGRAQAVDFAPREGDRVEVRALASFYQARGEFQLTVEAMRRAGAGDLFQRFLALKEQLQREGLLESARKRALPAAPRRVGVVTSPAAAALRDVLTTLARRAPHIPVILYPTPVQGAEAPGGLVAALGRAARRAECDVLLLVRGGGSIEDLWAFNEEAVVRAVAECTIPVISAVGHETDTTLCDFAADRRAPTPTAAAEMAVPVRADLVGQLAELALRQRRAVVRPLQLGRERLAARADRLPTPDALLAAKAQQLDDVSERFRRALTDRTALARGDLQRVAARLSLPLVKARLGSARGQLDGLVRLFVSLDPGKVLARGYVRVSNAAGRTLTSRTLAAKEAALTLHFHDGELAVASGGGPARPAPRPKPPAPQDDGPQGKLL